VAGDRLTGSDKRALFLWVWLYPRRAFASNIFQRFPRSLVNFQISARSAGARAEIRHAW